MRFKCYILSIQNKSQHFYSLNGHILQQVQNNLYLGLQISEDLKWTTHIANVAKKANSTLGFLRRNLKYCPQECKKTAYISLVRSTMEYGRIIWDPYTEANINRLERIQRQAATFITGDYRSREGIVSNMLVKLDLQLKERRTSQKLVQSGWGAGSCYWTRRLPEKITTQEIYHCQKKLRTTRQLTSLKNKWRTIQSVLTCHQAKHINSQIHSL